MIILLRRRRLRLLLLLAAATAGGILWASHAAARPAFAPAQSGQTVIILDAGHGGEDGGAVSRSGVPESRINLRITQKMQGLLLFLGRSSIMTREGEDAIYSPEAKTLREKKVSDLKNRVAIINAEPGAVLLSIHQNSLPSRPQVHGAQVFYNAVAPAAQAAQNIQDALNQTVNSGNEKSVKPIDGSIYLMKQIERPGILVECGFMSNAGEAELLQTEDYQLRLATAILAGYFQYSTKEG